MHSATQLEPARYRIVRAAAVVLLLLWTSILRVPASGIEFRLLHGFPTNSYPQCTLLFAALAGNAYGIHRSTSNCGPWEPVATVVADDCGVGRWADPPTQDNAFYRLVYP